MNFGLSANFPHQSVSVSASTVQLEGDLVAPADAQGVVLLVQGKEGNHWPDHSQYLAELLQRAGLATLLIDLLTPAEAAFEQRPQPLRLDAAGLLADRVVGATDWLRHTPATQHLKIGYLGEKTGGAAILAAAAKRPSMVKAVVSHGGWLDLVWSGLTQVQTPTLLIVGSMDLPAITVNEEAMFLMDQTPEKRLEIIPGASHGLMESQTLEQVATLTSEWFQRFLHP